MTTVRFSIAKESENRAVDGLDHPIGDVRFNLDQTESTYLGSR
jgi:hypothetical protein